MKFSPLTISLFSSCSLWSSIGVAHAQPFPLAATTTNLRGGGGYNTIEVQTQQSLLPDWAFCSTSDECMTGCCASRYSTDGRLKCTPLEGGVFQADICVIQQGSPEISSISTSSYGTCGDGSRGDGICADGTCCSQYGWCGVTPEFCDDGGSSTGDGGTTTGGGSSSGTCGGGDRGDGICADGTCCSQYGWCGVTPEFCDGGTGGGGTDGGTPTSPGTATVTSPAITLTTEQIQAGINTKGDDVSVSPQVVDMINKVTQGYSLYRQLAFVAHSIWESGSYQYKEELDTANYGNYQDCDWNQDGEQPPDNGKQFYGRGYLQLSWCANYKAYGASRMYQGDPNLFYNQPELLATDEFYAMDSAAWFFETLVSDTSGQFGLTTKAINGQLECSGEGADKAQKRYEIFVALANAAGMTGYSESGCYN